LIFCETLSQKNHFSFYFSNFTLLELEYFFIGYFFRVHYSKIID